MHIATSCNTLQHTATHCNTLQHNVHVVLKSFHIVPADVTRYQHRLGCSRRYHRTHCNTLQHTATLCNTLQHNVHLVPHSASSRDALPTPLGLLPTISSYNCNTQQRTATHCNTLPNTTTYCNSLQHNVHLVPHTTSSRNALPTPLGLLPMK